jgi:hypothetical protein
MADAKQRRAIRGADDHIVTLRPQRAALDAAVEQLSIHLMGLGAIGFRPDGSCGSQERLFRRWIVKLGEQAMAPLLADLGGIGEGLNDGAGELREFQDSRNLRG